MTAHTPGPWHVAQGSDDWDFIVAEPTGNTVCEPNTAVADFSDLDPNVHGISLVEAKANAHLIAAAPDLLTALKALADLYAELLDADLINDTAMTELRAARAAIAKAERAS